MRTGPSGVAAGGRVRPRYRQQRTPEAPPGDSSIVIQSQGLNSIVISDLPGPTGGILLKSNSGATIIVNDLGIFIENGKGASIVLSGPSVSINAGALVVP